MNHGQHSGHWQVTVRGATDTDLPPMLAVTGESPTAPRWSAEDLRAMLLPAGDGALRRTVLAAETEGMLAGFAVYTVLEVVYPPEAELESLAVAATHRRRGVGRALLRAVSKAVQREGAETLALEVRAGNEAALQLYHTEGFEAAGVRKRYYSEPPEDAVLMRLVFGDRKQPRSDGDDGPGASRMDDSYGA